ncbi:MAG: hypothetical protein AAFR20_00870 [Pseudomonadota bacterium]
MTQNVTSPMRRLPKILKLIQQQGLLPVIALYPDGSIQVGTTKPEKLDSEAKDIGNAIENAFGNENGQDH